MYLNVNIRGMYGLPQAGIQENKLLAQLLRNHGYYQAKQKTGLWGHVWRTILFTLLVKCFGINYV